MVERLAAGHAVAFVVGATVGAGHQMLHRGIVLWQQPATEETQAPWVKSRRSSCAVMEMLVFGLTGRCLKDISGAKGHRFDRAAPGGAADAMAGICPGTSFP